MENKKKESLKDIIEQNRDKEKPSYEIRTIGYEDRLSPEEEQALLSRFEWNYWDDEW